MNQPKIDSAPVKVNPADLYPNARTNGVAHTRALAAQLLARLVKAEVLATQFGDVYQSLDIHGVQRDENPEASH